MKNYDPVAAELNNHLAAEDEQAIRQKITDCARRNLESKYWEISAGRGDGNVANDFFTAVLDVVMSDWGSRQKIDQISDLVKTFRADKELWIARRMNGVDTHQGISLLMKQAE